MAVDLRLGIIRNGNYDLTLSSNQIPPFTIFSITPPTRITFVEPFNTDIPLDENNMFSAHFSNFAPEPLCLDTTYNFMGITPNPFTVDLILDDNNNQTLNGNFTPSSRINVINRDLSLVNDSEQVIQKVVQRVNTIKGE